MQLDVGATRAGEADDGVFRHARDFVPWAERLAQSPGDDKSRRGLDVILKEAERAARYRLVIEEGPQSGSFIYKTLDRITGEVVKQLPREQVVDLMQTAQYSAGSVIDTKA